MFAGCMKHETRVEDGPCVSRRPMQGVPIAEESPAGVYVCCDRDGSAARLIARRKLADGNRSTGYLGDSHALTVIVFESIRTEGVVVPSGP